MKATHEPDRPDAAIFAVMLVLMALRTPIAVAMFVAGAVGYVVQAGWLPLASFLNTQAFARFASYDLSRDPAVHPDGQLRHPGRHRQGAVRVRRGGDGALQGGLAMAAVLACAAFGAICGSSVATAATITRWRCPR